MKVIVKEPLKAPVVKEINGELKEFQELVGGYIEEIPITKPLWLYVNEEGNLKNLEPNIILPNAVLVGTVVVFQSNGSNEVDMEERYIEPVMKWLEAIAITEEES